ncbi:DNA topoisomerase IV, alpha subunit [Hypoxylon sp. FL1150]|nr:DNA topoisomerase IV, alpha subunit [Hypoxylon sp. FL1150]
MDVPPNDNAVPIARDEEGNPQPGGVIAEIEIILGNIVEALNENRVLTIPLRNRRSGNERLIRFPATAATEMKKFTCFLRILHLCHEALVNGYIITKRLIGLFILNMSRSIYYQDPGLFGNQQYVDRLVDDIAFTLGVGRDALNIAAASKGLIAGRAILTLSNNTTLDCSSNSSSIAIPQPEGICSVDIGETKWIMVIEKEATFRSLAASRFYERSAAGVGILVTGKGYPDLVTRQLLHLFHSTFPQVPIHALVDFDPSGIDIMLTYKRGSQSLRHEQNVTVPRLAWLGPKSCDVLGRTRHHLSLTILSQRNQSFIVTPPCSRDARPSAIRPNHVLSANSFEVASPLTAFDRRKAASLLSRLRDQHSNDDNEIGWLHELQVMLVLNFKAEIQIVDNNGDITHWLDEKLLESAL